MYKIYSKVIRQLLESKQKILVGYLLAGYKDENNFAECMKLLNDSAIGIFEIGFPSRNPYADGETIAKAHSKVNFEHATSIEYWKTIRNATDKAIWLMAYNEDFIKSGKYLQFAKEKVMDAVVIPDTDDETRKKIQEEIKEYNVDVIGFANPFMDKDQLYKVLDNFPIVYEQLYVGQTGIQQTKEIYHKMLELTTKHGKVKSFAGFGLDSYASVKKVLDEGFNGAIVGTEIIRKINKSKESLVDLLNEINKAVE
jgi:tryptophan synthase alpha chain